MCRESCGAWLYVAVGRSPLPQNVVPSSGGFAGMLDMVAEQKFGV
jgi:hypothetical protein